MTSKDDIHIYPDYTYFWKGFSFFLPDTPIEHIENVKDFYLHKDDILIVGFPKGNHWLLSIVYAIQNVDNLDAVEREGIKRRLSILEDVTYDHLPQDYPRPNVFFTHVSYNMLPHGVADKQNKVIYITRNPKDILVSYFYFNDVFLPTDERQYTWDEFFAKYLSSDPYTLKSWMHHVKDWLQYKDEPHVMFVEYEDLKQDPEHMIIKLAEFIGKNLTEDQVKKIAALTSFSNMQKNEELFIHLPAQLDRSKGQFIRKGQVGDWKSHFTVEQNEKFDSLYETFVSETGYRNKFEI